MNCLPERELKAEMDGAMKFDTQTNPKDNTMENKPFAMPFRLKSVQVTVLQVFEPTNPDDPEAVAATEQLNKPLIWNLEPSTFVMSEKNDIKKIRDDSGKLVSLKPLKPSHFSLSGDNFE